MSWPLLKFFIRERAEEVLFVIAMALLFGAIFFMYKFDSLHDRAEKAEAAAAQAYRVMDGMEVEIAANRKALDERTLEVARLLDENLALSGQLRGVYDAVPEARAWADTCLPDSVSCLLR